MQKRVIPVLLAAALLILGFISVVSIHDLQGGARVINYAGVVRGATQRLVKQELNGEANDALAAKLDGILEELATGRGENGLVRLEDGSFQELIGQMKTQWAAIKAEIPAVRGGGDGARLYRLSEEYFVLADQAVCAAEDYSAAQVRRAEQGLVILSGVFLLLAALLAWHGAVQARGQRALAEAEEANRRRREHLMQMSADLRAPMDEISEVMYVVDPETYQLLFINEKGRETFGITELETKKCYELLQGRDAPCEFCTTPLLVPGENYTWEYTNPLSKRHYLLKDRLLQWEGRPARMEIAFDITDAEAEKQTLKNTLDAQQMIMECVRMLYREHDLEQSLPAVLERLGNFLSAGRAYLGMIRDGLVYNDFEWCAEQMEPQKQALQGVPLEVIGRWVPIFGRQECVILEDLESLKEPYPEEYELLRAQDIHSLVAAPLEQDGTLLGLLGVDNPPPQQIRTIASLLQTLCYFVLLAHRRAENEQQLSQLSYHDTLTSFYNRNRYTEDCAALSKKAGPIGAVYLDVNGLKDTNDQYGHAAGDELLVQCARQMEEAFQEARYYRIGGDEFVILCPGIGRAVFEQRLAALRRGFERSPGCKAAIGAQWDEQCSDLEKITAGADAKMYEDKKEFYRQNPNSNRYRHHSDEMLPLADPKVLQEELRQERFVVYLQPKVSVADGSAVGAEALIRYRPRSGSLVLPGNFLPLLEESQTVSQIDFYVFEYACSRIKEWVRQGKQALPVSVNFSRSSLAQPDFAARLTGLCQKYGVDKKYLQIELTETMRDADGVDMKALIREVRQAGFGISIDDFGTEYANLAMLSAVEFDVLKLDKSLVDDVATNPKARTVVETIADICKKMQIEVVAEGIETEEQLAVLRACGVELVQGFLFSRPIPIEEYEAKYL